ncbi:MAG: hypothetical protein ABID87_05280 [Chloroflexota bacterium]
MSIKTALAEATRRLEEVFQKLDVEAIGVVNLEDDPGSRLAETAQQLLPGTNAVVVFGMEVYPEVLDLSRADRTAGAASLNDLLVRHNEYLSGRLNKAAYDVARASRSAGYKALPLPSAGCPTDTRFLQAVFSYKHAAVAAGMGYLGRSSLLITPEYGSRVRLSCCLTEVPLETTASKTFSEMCSGCDICLSNCPSGALTGAAEDEPYAINKFACGAFRTNAGGCSECVRLCPAGQ